jgi:hypothetical protein
LDDLVKQAIAKWPNVPDCYGWLGLDARGNWYMRDDQAQALGTFDSGRPGSKGSELRHAKLVDFIGRNYASDARGCWYFQNGPQRVFVELQATPWVWRVEANGRVLDHMAGPAEVSSSYVDEQGWLYLASNRGLGLVHTQDMHLAADLIEQGTWTPQELQRAELPARFGFVKSPLALTTLFKQ